MRLRTIPRLVVVAIFFAIPLFAKSQIRFSANYGLDFYQHFTNPEVEGDTTLRTAGNAIANIMIGPRVFIGFKNFTISGETQANWGITTLCLKDFKGVGSISLPLMVKLNFGGLSGVNADIGAFGVAFGGGVQYSMTELYGLTEEYRNSTAVRDINKYYVGEFQIGYRAESGVASFHFRYGQGENNASLFHIGYSVSYIFPSGSYRGSNKGGIFRPPHKR